MRAAPLVLTLALGAQAQAADGGAGPALDSRHRHPSGAFTFRTPADWTVKPGERPGSLLATGSGPAAGAHVLFNYEPRDLGYDSLHVSCMDITLRGPMETAPQRKYEYDFLSSTVGEQRVLDSAFWLHYDPPVDGEREWRQRNVTVVGAQQSLCVIAYMPRRVWKKSREARALVDAVVQSLEFPPAEKR